MYIYYLVMPLTWLARKSRERLNTRRQLASKCLSYLVIIRTFFVYVYFFAITTYTQFFKYEKIISTYHNFSNPLLLLEKKYLRNWLHKSATHFCKLWKYIIVFVEESNFSDGPTFFLAVIKYDLWMEILKKISYFIKKTGATSLNIALFLEF